MSIDEWDVRTEKEIERDRKKKQSIAQRKYVEKYLRASEFLKYMIEFSKSFIKKVYDKKDEEYGENVH